MQSQIALDTKFPKCSALDQRVVDVDHGTRVTVGDAVPDVLKRRIYAGAFGVKLSVSLSISALPNNSATECDKEFGIHELGPLHFQRSIC